MLAACTAHRASQHRSDPCGHSPTARRRRSRKWSPTSSATMPRSPTIPAPAEGESESSANVSKSAGRCTRPPCPPRVTTPHSRLLLAPDFCGSRTQEGCAYRLDTKAVDPLEYACLPPSKRSSGPHLKWRHSYSTDQRTGLEFAVVRRITQRRHKENAIYVRRQRPRYWFPVTHTHTVEPQ